jgi:hypothetical protein
LSAGGVAYALLVAIGEQSRINDIAEHSTAEHGTAEHGNAKHDAPCLVYQQRPVGTELDDYSPHTDGNDDESNTDDEKSNANW